MRETMEMKDFGSTGKDWVPPMSDARWALGPTEPPAIPQDLPEERLRFENQFKSGANWFFWIAGLSIVNSVVILTGGAWSFIIGLGVTQIIDVIGYEMGSIGTAVALGLDMLAAGVFVLFGALARKGYAAAFITGMVLYALDGLIFFAVADWLSVGFHAFALFCIFSGLTARRRLTDLHQQPQTAVA